jgi:hypothetical protein
MLTPPRNNAPTEKRLERNPLLDQLSGDAGAKARAQKLAQLDEISARIQGRRNAGASRQGFLALEQLTEAVVLARETVEALAKA